MLGKKKVILPAGSKMAFLAVVVSSEGHLCTIAELRLVS